MREYDEKGRLKREAIEAPTAAERQVYEIWLTLADCNIVDHDKVGLCTFVEDGSLGKKVEEPFSVFQNRWEDNIPYQIALAIHARCIEVNSHWAIKWDEILKSAQGED